MSDRGTGDRGTGDRGTARGGDGGAIRIATIGDLILDVVVLPRRALAPDGDTPAEIRITGGGQAANVAAWASSLGARSRLICARGDDPGSALAAAELVRHGVDLRGHVVPGRGGVVVSLRERGGRRTMASDRGVAALLGPEQLDPTWLDGCDVLHVSGYCLLTEGGAGAAARAAALVPRVSLDLSSSQDIHAAGAGRYRARLAALAPDLIFATESERDALPWRDAAWVIKRGARGAEFPEGIFPARPAPAVDMTGAGDALAAGYLVGGPELALEAAARCIAHAGAMPPGPRLCGGD